MKSSNIAQIPSPISTRFITEASDDAFPTKATDFCERAANALLAGWRTASKRVKIGNGTYTLKAPLASNSTVVHSFKKALGTLLFILGLIFLSLSKTHRICHLLVLSEASRRDGNLEKAHKCAIEALKLDHTQKWTSCWISRMAWKKFLIPDSSQQANGRKSRPLKERVAVATLLMKHLSCTYIDNTILDACERMFSLFLNKKKEEGFGPFKRAAQGLNGLPIQALDIPDLSLKEARCLKAYLPTIKHLQWTIPDSDRENLERAKQHLECARLFVDKSSYDTYDIFLSTKNELSPSDSEKPDFGVEGPLACSWDDLTEDQLPEDPAKIRCKQPSYRPLATTQSVASQLSLSIQQRLDKAIIGQPSDFDQIIEKISGCWLTSLELQNPISCEQLKQLTHLPYLKRLRLLDCSKLKKEHVKQLKGLLHLEELVITMEIDKKSKHVLQTCLQCSISTEK